VSIDSVSSTDSGNLSNDFSADQVNDSVAQIQDSLNESWRDWDVNNSDLKQINQSLDRLNPEEKNSAISQLSDNTLEKWGNELDGMIGGLSKDELTDVYNSLARDLDAKQLARVYSAFGEDHQQGLANAISSHTDVSTRAEFVQNVQQSALQNIEVPPGLTEEQKALYLDLAQLGLDVVGIVEPTPFADGSNAVISMFRGDWLGAGLSALSIVPYVGDLAKLGKLGKWADTVTNVIEMAAKNADFAKVAEPVLKQIDEAIAAIPDSVMRELPESAQDVLKSIRDKIDDFAARGDSAGVNPKTRIPRTDGNWVGEPGNGYWHSTLDEVNEVTGGNPIQFIDGRPDFTPWSKGQITFKPGQLDGTKADFDAVYDFVAQQKNLPSRNAAKNYLKEAGLTPHHLDGATIQLIPTKLHGNIPHIGSASDLRGGY
jgi:hypothetical protein